VRSLVANVRSLVANVRSLVAQPLRSSQDSRSERAAAPARLGFHHQPA